MNDLVNKKLFLIISLFILVILITIINISFSYKFKDVESENIYFKDNIYLTKSDCTNMSGEKLSNVTDYDGEEVLIDPTKTMYCKLEFGVPESSVITYDPQKSHATNEDGSPCINIQCAIDGLYKLYRSNKNEE